MQRRSLTGGLHSPLTALGVAAARQLAPEIPEVDVVYASPSGRTLQTVNILFGGQNIVCDHRLREIDLGDWEGRLEADLDIEDPEMHSNFWSAPNCHQKEGAETFTQVADRAVEFLKKIAEHHEGETIAVVSHTTVIRSILFSIEPRELSEFGSPPASVRWNLLTVFSALSVSAAPLIMSMSTMERIDLDDPSFPRVGKIVLNFPNPWKISAKLPAMQWPEHIRKKLRALPDAPGVYLMRGRDGAIIYVGKAASLRKRVGSYFRESTLRKAEPKIRGLIRSIKDFDVLVLKSEAEALLTEGQLIKEYKPRYNTLLKDDKRFPLLRTDLRKPFPKFELCRINKNDGGTYFGPYTSGQAARAALEFVEKRFGIRQCRPIRPDADTYKHCNNDIIRHCAAPCIGTVTSDEYCERVETACAFLRGERPEFIKEIRAQMEAAAEEHEFEEAAALRDMMLLLLRAVKERALVCKTDKMKTTDALLGIKELGEKLGLNQPPRVIECFDISNISGTYAVASMVAAVDGVPTPQRYRRFRIKTVEGSDDPRMMAEAVRRRYSRLQKEQGAMPDLLIVDGGITQLRAARAELLKLGVDLPSVGLAKQFEELVRDDQPPLRLPKDSVARAVVTGLRDEAHRFAISYHRTLRNQRIRESALDEIPTIGKKTKERLLAHFGSFARLRKASLQELQAAPGIGPKTAQLIRDAIHTPGP